MTFDELLAASREPEFEIPAAWGQGRAIFGGLVGAIAYARMAALVSPGRPMRSLQVSFVGPVIADQPVTAQTQVLREGKAVSQAECRLVQDGETRLVALASFGGGRESAVQVDALAAPQPEVAREKSQSLPFIEGVTPEFTRYIELAWGFGAFPFTGKKGREMGGWMRFREAPEALADAHLIALVDAWPTALLQHLNQRAPASSLSWALEMVHPRPQLAADDWLLYRSFIDQAGSGYGHTQAGIWSSQGELVALSRQVVTVFG